MRLLVPDFHLLPALRNVATRRLNQQWFRPHLLDFQSRSLLIMGKAADSRAWTIDTHTRDLDEVSGLWPQPGAALASELTWGVNH